VKLDDFYLEDINSLFSATGTYLERCV